MDTSTCSAMAAAARWAASGDEPRDTGDPVALAIEARPAVAPHGMESEAVADALRALPEILPTAGWPVDRFDVLFQDDEHESAVAPAPRVILLVDDEPFVLRAVARSLRQGDYRVLTAQSAADALQLLDDQLVHLVISDHRMPVMTGTKFLSMVKERFPDTMRIMLSGYADVPSVTEAMRLGAIYRFVPKPWCERELLRVVASALVFGENDREWRERQARSA